MNSGSYLFHPLFFKGNTITNGYWFNLKLDFDFVSNDLSIYVNNTRIISTELYTSETIKINEDFNNINDMNLIFDFYLQPRFYFGGYKYSQIQQIIDNLSRSRKGREILSYFMDLFVDLLYLNERIYFSGCMKNIKINNFPLDFNDLLYIIEYKHVRFDGCPSVKNLELLESKLFNQHLPRIEIISNTTSVSEAFDSSFNSFTEYFYRVVAVNTQGESASSWILVRTPEAILENYIDLKYLDASPISGYKILVRKMSNFCYYCDSASQANEVFKGFTNRFVLTINEFTTSEFTFLRNVTFYCEKTCVKNYENSNKNIYNDQTAIKSSDTNSKELLIDTKPITEYELIVSVCTLTGCTSSKNFYLKTFKEAPTNVNPPVLKKSAFNSLDLTWNKPNNSNGEPHF